MRPDWIEPDPQPGVARYFGIVPEFGGRVLRVVIAETADERRILTAHFDRNARRGSR